MAKKYVMALDAGTTSNRAIIFDENSKIVGVSQKEFTKIFPQPGWVEHDADEIWSTMTTVMKEALELLNKMERNLDGKELHLPTDVQSPADMIAPTNAKHANKQLKLLVDRKGDELSRFEKRTAELGVASLVFEEMLKGSMGDEYRIKINDKEEFKSVIKKIANSDAIKKKFNKKKVTGDTVKEAITPENIKKIAKDITKEKEMTPEKLKPQAKVQMFK